jgi:large subunit ribosomal protein L31
MKSGIHPEYKDVIITCACGAVYNTRSTRLGNFTVEICSSCHPFYTGKEKSAESKGRVERFRRRYGEKQAS